MRNRTTAAAEWGPPKPASRPPTYRLLLASRFACSDGRYGNGCQFVRLLHEGFQFLVFDEASFDEEFHPVKRFVNFFLDDSPLGAKLVAGAGPPSRTVIAPRKGRHEAAACR